MCKLMGSAVSALARSYASSAATLTVCGPLISPSSPRSVCRQHILEVIPDLVIEILSKHDTVEAISDKIDDWLGAGVQMLWIVDPFRRTVTIYQPGHDPTLLGEHGILEGDPIIAGFRCPVAEIFA
jgi:Uma2 family endonuclease